MNFRKIFFVFGALGMLLSSCSKVSEIEYLDESAGLQREITATFDATRTSIDNDWNTTWDDNDEMTVYVTRESSREYKYGYSQFKYKGDGKFEGTVNKDICSPFNWFAVYPSFKTSSSTSSVVEAEIEHPAAQTMTGDTKSHIAGANDPIFGYALGVKDNPTIRMHHIASVIDFNFTNGSDNTIKVTKVEFTAPEKIAGKFTADVDLWNGDVQTPEWKADKSAVNTVTLNVSDGAEIAKNGNGHFYVAIHPISVEGDYTIKVTATSEGKTYVSEKTVNADLAFEAGKYRTLNFTFVPGEPEPDQKSYVKVTSAPQDWSGTYLIVDESAKKAFNENASSYASSVTINDGKVLWDEDVAKYQVTISPSTVSGMYDIKTVKGKYMYSYNDGETTLNSSNTKTSSGKTNTYYNSLSISGGNVTMYSTRNGSSGASVNYFGYVSNPSDKTSGNPNGKNFGYKKDATTRTVQLYKLNEGTPSKQDQTLSFEKSEIEWTLGDTYKVGNTYTAQSVNGAKTTVTYTSSNESVATVASDGKITIKGNGESTITATAAEDATYNSATASYSLTIKPASAPSTEKTYTKVSSLSNLTDGTYIICGYESDEGKKGAYVCLFPPVTATSSSIKTSNRCNDFKFSEDCDITEITTDDADIIGSEVKITKSGSSYLIQYDGQYMYYNTGAIAFTTSSSSALQTIGSFDSKGKASMKQGSQVFYHSGSDRAFGYTANKSATNLMFFKLGDSPTPPTPSTEKTYTKVTTAPSDWSGTYLIVDENSKNAFAYDQTGYKKSVSISSSKIVSNDLEKYEVTISVASGSDATHYNIKTSNGKYLYRISDSNFLNDSETYNSNKYYAKIGEEGFISLGTKRSGGTEYFFRYSSSAFGFGTDKTATIQLYKLQGSSPTPTPVTASLDIENEKLAAYLDAVEKNPYFTNNTFGSYSSYYTSSLMKNNSYYSGSSASNRLDQPAPVVLTWTGNATKVEVFTSSSKTTDSRVASLTFTSSSSADVYNLIPGQKYYYTASNGSTTVAAGDFTPEGRRRMIKVSSSFDDSHAANCRDLGGLPTVDGKHVKYGLIYRGSNIDGLSRDNDAKDVFLNTMKIKWDIDLRASDEKKSAPTLSGVSKGTQSYSAKFDDSNLRSKTKMATTVKEIIDAINKDTPEPVYIHCRIGSDRTGYVCLLIEALIGVTQNYCDTDYEITSFTGNVTGTRFRVDNTIGGGMYKSGINYFADFSGTTLHDKVYNFVTSSNGLNISKTDVDKFISRMTE